MMNPNRIRVLMVEADDLAARDSMAALADGEFHLVARCRDGAFEGMDGADVDVVLLGAKMEGGDRLGVVRRLMEGRKVGVVHLLAGAELKQAEALLETGEVLVAPVSNVQLRLSVKAAAAKVRMRRKEVGGEVSCLEFFEAMDEGVLMTDTGGQVVFLNGVATRLLGWSGEEAEGRDVREVYPARLSAAAGVEGLERLQEGRQNGPREMLLVTRDGKSQVLEERAVALHEQDGRTAGMVLFFHELSHPRGSARTLDLVAGIMDPLLVVDGDGRLLWVNAAGERWLGGGTGTSSEGLPLMEVLPAGVRRQEGLLRLLRRGVTGCVELFQGDAGGWLEVQGYPYAGGWVLWVRDITARKLEEDRVSRMDRLESLGLLARGFAHDFNNLLTVLLGNLSLAEMRFGGRKENVTEVAAAKQATLQAQNLVQQLLTFARGGAPIKQPTSLPLLVKHFFQNHPRVDRVRYEVEVQEGLPVLALDPNQIRRLLGNLVRNAEQALTQGGRIQVRCEAAETSIMFPHEVLPEALSTLAGIVLEVEDDGEGIAPQHLPHIFEPYFSTRKEENATGLGLTVCESIAKAHGGTINIYAVSPHGTRVRFFLPVDDEEIPPPEEMMLEPVLDEKSSEPARILVLEDDDLVRTLLARGLRNAGYEVMETVEGAETVRVYEEAMVAGRGFRLVILDLSIPNGMGGVETMERLRALDSQVLAMVSSGYSDDPVMAAPAAYGFAAVLPKPYEPAELLALVRRLLASRVSGEVDG